MNAGSFQPAHLSPEKLLAIGAYGETVAAYRYLVLSEKASDETDRRLFARLADEEQGHKQRLQRILIQRYPEADFFVLTPADKELVITGPRLLDVHREVGFAEAMEMMLETEKKVTEFYARHGHDLADADLRHLFHQLAEEGQEHYSRLRAMVEERTALANKSTGHGIQDSTNSTS